MSMALILTEPVHLTHLEAMGICMALRDAERLGLSEPQADAFEKVRAALDVHMRRLGRPA